MFRQYPTNSPSSSSIHFFECQSLYKWFGTPARVISGVHSTGKKGLWSAEGTADNIIDIFGLPGRYPTQNHSA